MLDGIGVGKCYLKYISGGTEKSNFTKKVHHHTGFEVHILLCGEQKYEFSEEELTVSQGEMLVIPPNLTHRLISTSADIEKFSLCFDKRLDFATPFLHAIADEALIHELDSARREFLAETDFSEQIISSAVVKATSLVLRAVGIKNSSPKPQHDESAIFVFAKRFVDDNICTAVSVDDVAKYCHISSKQLSRIFKRECGVTIGAYVRRERTELIRRMLDEGELTLSEISEATGFQNEYYFNAFFKKNAGMSPGAYRKAVNK